VRQVIVVRGLKHAAVDALQTTVCSPLRGLVAGFPPEATAVRTGVPDDVVRSLARDFAAAPTAAAYGRTGACLGRDGTLVSFLLDALSIVTGNLDREGGLLMAHAVIPFAELGERTGRLTYRTER